MTLVKDLFARQQNLNSKMKKILFDAETQLIIETQHLQADPIL